KKRGGSPWRDSLRSHERRRISLLRGRLLLRTAKESSPDGDEDGAEEHERTRAVRRARRWQVLYARDSLALALCLGRGTLRTRRDLWTRLESGNHGATGHARRRDAFGVRRTGGRRRASRGRARGGRGRRAACADPSA